MIVKTPKVVKTSLSLLLIGIISFVIIAGAALAVPVPVLALSATGIRTTIASIVMSLLLQAGVGVIDQTYVNKLNNAYGAESQFGTIEDMVANGLLVDENGVLNDAGLENAIQSVPEYEELFLGDLFSITEGAAVGVAASSGAHNILTATISCGTIGTIGAFAGAAAVGVGLGFLINNVRENIGKLISNNISMTEAQALGQYATESSATCIVKNTDTKNYIYMFYGDTFTGISLQSNNLLSTSIIHGQGVPWRLIVTNNGIVTTTNTYNWASYSSGVTPSKCRGVPVFQTDEAYYNKLAEIENGAAQTGETEYYTGPYGNQGYEKRNGNVNYPGIKSMVPDGYDMRPVDMDDYINYMNQAKQDTENNVSQDIIADNFNDFVNDHLVREAENPEDIYNPTIPESSNPIIPDQPTIPNKPDITIGDRDSSLIGTTEGLQNVFPFCIPFDIYDMLTGLTATRAAPSLHVPVGDGQYLDVDLSDYEAAASILRALELIAFIVGLAVATRSLIGAKG